MSKTERSEVLTGRNEDQGKGKFSRGMESKPEILNVPGPLLFSHTDTFFSHFRDCSNHKSDIRRVCAILGIALTCEAKPSHV